MKFCSNCGQALAAGAKFCPACGQPVAAPQPTSTANSTANQSAVDHSTADVNPAPESSAASEPQAATTQATAAQPTSDTSHATTPDQPQLGFVGSIQYLMQHAFEFNGDVPESRKSVFWWGYLGVVLLNVAFVGIPYLGTFLCWATQGLLISAMMRRLAYLHQNPGLGWLVMVPIVSLYPLFLMFLDRKVD